MSRKDKNRSIDLGDIDKKDQVSLLQKGAYHFIYGLIYTLSLLPFWFWYGMSNFAAFLLRVVVGYRKAVVYENIKTSFPEKSDAQIKKIIRDFYRHFTDVTVETIKGISLSESQWRKRVHVLNPEVIDEMQNRDRGNLLVGTHFGNFEWMVTRIAIECQGKIPSYGIYSPFRSWVFNKLVLKFRTRFNAHMLPMRNAMVQAVRKVQETCFFGFINDQSPHHGQKLYFTPLLGRATAYHTSVSKIGLKTKVPVFYASTKKVKRGYYTLEFVDMHSEKYLPYSQENIYLFTDRQAALLEESIRNQPAYWLWSHRRWKHSFREGDVVSPNLPETGN